MKDDLRISFNDRINFFIHLILDCIQIIYIYFYTKKLYRGRWCGRLDAGRGDIAFLLRNDWNVSYVGNMRFMFCNASSFNQPLNDWNVEVGENGPTAYDDVCGMFYGATSFNQPLHAPWYQDGMHEESESE